MAGEHRTADPYDDTVALIGHALDEVHRQRVLLDAGEADDPLASVERAVRALEVAGKLIDATALWKAAS